MTSEAALGAAAGSTTAAGRSRIRPATVDDLPACAAIWRHAINDYIRPLNQPDVPDELGPILRLYQHLQRTDPERFLVVDRDPDAPAPDPPPPGTAGLVAFGVAYVREPLWFLSMLFVLPEAQGRGLGRSLLARLAPTSTDGPRATATDSVQPISNGLYGSLGIVARTPLFRLVGLPRIAEPGLVLPPGIQPIRFDEVDGPGGDGLAASALAAELAALDAGALGAEHGPEHAFLAAEGNRTGFLYRGPDGRAVGYGYTSETGRVGPVAVHDEALLGPIVGHLVRAVEPRGEFGIWLPGTAGPVMAALLRTGFRIDGFPILLCWDRPFADFARYLPISPGIL